MPDTTAVPINAIFLLDSLVSPERRDAIVNRVLNEFPNLPVAAKNTLRSVVNDEVPPPGGFRRGQAGRALGSSGFLLQNPSRRPWLPPAPWRPPCFIPGPSLIPS